MYHIVDSLMSAEGVGRACCSGNEFENHAVIAWMGLLDISTTGYSL